MVERATLNEKTQIGVETSAGSKATVTKRLQGLSIAPAVKAEVSTFRPKGAKFVTMASLGKEWTEADLSGQLSYNDIVYVLASLFSYQEPTTEGTKAYRWTFTPSHNAADTVKTYTVESGSTVRAGSFSYGIVTEFGWKFSRDSIEPSGVMLGQAYEDDITITADDVEDVEPVPVLPTQLDLYLDDSADDLGDTQLTRTFQGEFVMSDRFGPAWTINSSLTSWAAHVETEPSTQLKLKLEADEQGMAMLDKMRRGTKAFIRFKATGDQIETNINYLIQLDMCGTVGDVSEFSDEDGLYTIEWTFNATYDGTWGKALTCDVVNTLASL